MGLDLQVEEVLKVEEFAPNPRLSEKKFVLFTSIGHFRGLQMTYFELLNFPVHDQLCTTSTCRLLHVLCKRVFFQTLKF